MLPSMPCNCTQLFCDKEFSLCFIPGIDGACIRIRQFFKSTINYRANVFIKWTIFIYVWKIKCFESDNAMYDFPLNCLHYILMVVYNQAKPKGSHWKSFLTFYFKVHWNPPLTHLLNSHWSVGLEVRTRACFLTCHHLWWSKNMPMCFCVEVAEETKDHKSSFLVGNQNACCQEDAHPGRLEMQVDPLDFLLWVSCFSITSALEVFI